jgi:limonene-1,2-epoxide hydrolase
MHSEILERGDGYIVREMFQPQPVALTIREKISEREVPGGTEFLYDQLNNSDYTGLFHNVLTRVPGDESRCELEYIMDWKPRAGAADKLSSETAQAMVERGVKFLQAMAENPVVVPDLVRKFFEAVDSMKPDAMAPLLASNCKLRVANHTETIGVENIVNLNREVMKRFVAVSHDYVDVVAVGNRVYAETYVEYLLPNKKSYILPFMTVFEHRDNRITSVKIFGDMSPLKHGWE